MLQGIFCLLHDVLYNGLGYNIEGARDIITTVISSKYERMTYCLYRLYILSDDSLTCNHKTCLPF